MSDFETLTRCVVCDNDRMMYFFGLAEQPLANAFHDGKQPQTRYPLGLQCCPLCWHTQQLIALKPELLYKDYPYASGTSASLKQYFSGLADTLDAARLDSATGLPRALNILEIASNDGTLLTLLRDRGHQVIGVDPASNLAPPPPIPTIEGFWNEASQNAALETRGPFDIILALNVLGHVKDPKAFLQLAKGALAEGGRIVVQTSQARMIENAEFDTAYHEHISFFTVSSLVKLADKTGLRLGAVAHVPVHGTSYLAEFVIDKHATDKQSFLHLPLGREEFEKGYYRQDMYFAFADKAYRKCDEVRKFVREAKGRIVGYGAAAKAMLLLNAAKVRPEFIVDDSALKIGKLTPGTDTPVVDIGEIARLPTKQNAKPVVFLILAWNMRDEIVEKIKQVRQFEGDSFVTFFPTTHIEVAPAPKLMATPIIDTEELA